MGNALPLDPKSPRKVVRGGSVFWNVTRIQKSFFPIPRRTTRQGRFHIRAHTRVGARLLTAGALRHRARPKTICPRRRMSPGLSLRPACGRWRPHLALGRGRACLRAVA